MHIGGQPVRVDGSARGGQALRDELTAERALALWAAGRADPRVVIAAGGKLEQVQQSAHRTVPDLGVAPATTFDSVSPSISDLLSPNHSVSTPPVSSPSAGAGTAGG